MTAAPRSRLGRRGRFQATASGFPAATFSKVGALPSGVTLNSAGLLSGTPAAATGGIYPITITATNGIGSPSQQSFTLVVNEKPTFTSGTATTFLVGTPGTFQATTSGHPNSTFSIVSGVLPNGVTLNSAGLLSGTPATGTGGTFPIIIKAQNGVSPDATQVFTLTVNEAATITSGNSATFIVGTAGSFTVFTGHSYPSFPTLSELGSLPPGVTFNDNGNGTGTFTGTPNASTSGVYNLIITAANGVGTPVNQSFTLSVHDKPTIISSNTTTFTTGNAGNFTVLTNGFPASTFSKVGALPSGVTLSSAGVLSGTPAAGTSGTYPITITASNGVNPDATQNFTLVVNPGPEFTSSNTATFAVGTLGNFQATVINLPGATFSLTAGTLPSGVTLNSAGLLSGTPAIGTSGVYPITIAVANGSGTTASQNFTLNVSGPPRFTSLNAATFIAGSPGSFAVTAMGFPVPTFTRSGTLPPGVTFNTTTGILSGTPSATTGKVYTVTFKATNSFGNVSQSFMLTVNRAPAITSANNATFTAGKVGTFTAKATGFPAATFSLVGTLPSGVTFNSTTGVLSGTPAAGTGGTYPVTITASNAVVADAVQSFTLTVKEKPTVTSASATTFQTGDSASFQVTSVGFPAATYSISGALPSGVTFNTTTGLLSGTPSATSGKVYILKITAKNGTTPNAVQTFTLTVNQPPAITSSNAATFTVGRLGKFTMKASGFPAPTFSVLEPLPAGLSLNPTTGVLNGIPLAGTSGIYFLTIKASNGLVPDAVQTFTLTIV